MKFKHCLTMAIQEIKVNIRLFLFYIIIFVCLFSISSALLELAMFLPDMISSEVAKSYSDVIIITDFKDENNDLLKNYKIEVVECSPSLDYFTSENLVVEDKKSKDVFYGGIILDKLPLSKINSYINNNIIKGKGTDNQLNYKNSFPIWISKELADALNLKENQLLKFSVNQQELCSIYVCGIYKSSDDFQSYYVSSEVYKLYGQKYPNGTISLSIRPLKFKYIYSMINDLTKKNLSIVYSEDTVVSTKMMYYTFYSINIILLITLTSILSNLINFYFEKRKAFFQVNSSLGMSKQDIVKIMFFISEIVIALSVFISAIVSTFILKEIVAYTHSIFTAVHSNTKIPVIALVINFLILQLLFGIIIINFNLKNRKLEIINGIKNV